MSREENKVFVGKLSRRVRQSDLEESFEKFGKVIDVEMRSTYAFV